MLNLNIDQQKFREEFFEKNILFQRRVISTKPINWQRINEILYERDPVESGVKLFLNGLVPHSQYTIRYQDVDVLRYRMHRESLDAYLKLGGTLVFSRLDQQDLMLGTLCKLLSNFTGLKTVANGYVAFGGGGTFGKHWDTHDVFAVQLLGRKHWKVFSPSFELPLPTQTSKNFKNDCPPNPIFDQILEEGDLLYIPRGWWHEATPVPGHETFHISAGIHTGKIIDYFFWLTQEILPSFLESRKTLIIGKDQALELKDFSTMLADIISNKNHLNSFLEKMEKLNNMYDPIDLNETRNSIFIGIN